MIPLGHGSGGKLSHQLLDDLIIPKLSQTPASGQNDAALLEIGGARLAFTTDSYVVAPIFFPGGNLGRIIWQLETTLKFRHEDFQWLGQLNKKRHLR